MRQFHSSRQSALWRIGAGFVVAAGLLAATLARADYLWIQPEANGAKVFADELRKPLESLPVLLDATLNSKKYDDVRHTATLSFEVSR